MRVKLVDVGSWVRQLPPARCIDDQTECGVVSETSCPAQCVICLHSITPISPAVEFPCNCSSRAMHPGCLIEYLLSCCDMAGSESSASHDGASIGMSPKCPHCRQCNASSGLKLISGNVQTLLTKSARMPTRSDSVFCTISRWCRDNMPLPTAHPASNVSDATQSSGNERLVCADSRFSFTDAKPEEDAPSTSSLDCLSLSHSYCATLPAVRKC